MKHSTWKVAAIHLAAGVAVAVLALTSFQAVAQNEQVQQRLEEIKQSSAANKVALSHYTWQEQQTISLKGEVKKTVVYQVSSGAGGAQQKVEISSSPAPQAPSGGKLKRHIVEKKTDEFKDYGQQVAALAKQYAQPDSAALQEAYQKGNVSLQPGGGEGTVSLVIKNYIKPNDSMTLMFNRQTKGIQSVEVSSYLSDPSDAVTMQIQFAKLPDGTNHVANMTLNGVSKHMTVATQNSNYQKM